MTSKKEDSSDIEISVPTTDAISEESPVMEELDPRKKPVVGKLDKKCIWCLRSVPLLENHRHCQLCDEKFQASKLQDLQEM